MEIVGPVSPNHALQRTFGSLVARASLCYSYPFLIAQVAELDPLGVIATRRPVQSSFSFCVCCFGNLVGYYTVLQPTLRSRSVGI